MIIRDALPEDAAAICEIYNPFVLNTSISFEVDPVNEEEMKKRILDYQKSYPYLVILQGDQLLGFAYASSWRNRYAYRFCVETSIYMAEAARGTGLAQMLYSTLLNQLRDRGFTEVIAGMGGDNPASERFHQNLGFNFIGKFERVGYKFDQWHPATFYQLSL